MRSIKCDQVGSSQAKRAFNFFPPDVRLRFRLYTIVRVLNEMQTAFQSGQNGLKSGATTTDLVANANGPQRILLCRVGNKTRVSLARVLVIYAFTFRCLPTKCSFFLSKHLTIFLHFNTQYRNKLILTWVAESRDY